MSINASVHGAVWHAGSGSDCETCWEDEVEAMPRCSTHCPVDSIASTGNATDDDSESSCPLQGASPVAGRVLSLSRSPEGSRRVQAALEGAGSDGERQALAREMHGHALVLMRCPHANHMLQKLISTMPPSSLQFIVDEILKPGGMVSKLAKHRFSTRIIQQLLVKCETAQVREIMDALLPDALALSCHSFGHYSIERLLQSGTAEQQYRCVRLLEQNMASLVSNPHGVSVVAAALEHAPPADKIWIARAVIQDPAPLLQLAVRRYGVGLVAQVMAALRGDARAQAQAHRSFTAHMADLKASRYGRKVAAHLEALAAGSTM